jgi:hypothetical protein
MIQDQIGGFKSTGIFALLARQENELIQMDWYNQQAEAARLLMIPAVGHSQS